MTSLYRKILTNAWLITKKHYYLWPLGFFVAFLGNGGEYQMLSRQIERVNLQPETIFSLSEWFNTSIFQDWDLTIVRGFLLALFVLFILGIIYLIIWLIISSMAGLIQGCASADKKERKTFFGLLTTGRKNFKPVFLLFLIAKVIVYGILVLILTPIMLATFAQQNESLNVFIIFLTFLIFVPLSIIVSFVTRFASAYVVLEGQKMWDAFKNGWRLFSANWLISLEMAAILLFINFCISLVVLAAFFLIFSPFFFVGISSSFASPGIFWTIIMIPVIIIILLFIFIGSLLATFQVNSWTLLYLRLTEGRKAYSKLVRWAAVLPSKLKPRQ
ncbi:hypothetical protein HOE31_01095 [bacterium]|jgi:hypothetical protein|nr:hypothetical protein [bacterium]MBT4121531.1 hypothetical protein [bacterium]MBT4335330.1 hypothetical protein [bacterium]MBT4495224.1 hypothetical protein [bacterium]MBT4763558.1 hypothetical protein [bacterium]